MFHHDQCYKIGLLSVFLFCLIFIPTLLSRAANKSKKYVLLAVSADRGRRHGVRTSTSRLLEKAALAASRGHRYLYNTTLCSTRTLCLVQRIWSCLMYWSSIIERKKNPTDTMFHSITVQRNNTFESM